MAIRGIEVTVIHPNQDQDILDEPIGGDGIREKVSNVLVAPGTTKNMDETRPHGVIADLTIHFPKTYTASLRGCSVELPKPWEGTYRIIGDPMPYMRSPGPWNRPVEVTSHDG